ncbi:hypothetical protein D3C72_2238390 [compost metagenome]
MDALTDNGTETQNSDNWFRDEGNKITNNLDNTANTVTGTYNEGYNAVRTSTAEATDANNTLFGMSGTAWTWLILGIAGIIIIGLVWYYSMQVSSNKYED